jgi:o-succinylbenzoate synthase
MERSLVLELFTRPVNYPLRKRLVVGGQVLSHREVIEFQLRQGDRVVASAELSPLQGLHSENLKQSLSLCKAAWPGLVGKLTPLLEEARSFAQEKVQQLSTVNALFASSVAPLFKHLPSQCRMAFESLILDVCFHGEEPIPPEQSALLFDGSLQDAQTFLARHRDARTVKIKVGRDEFGKDLAVLDALRQALPHCALRLDANRAWTKQQIPSVAKALAHYAPSFVEEPCASVRDLPFWRACGGSAVALDESLWLDPQSPHLKDPIVETLVLKPSRIGLAQTLAYMQSDHPGTVLSACFEGELGMRSLYRLAQLHPNPRVHGFGTIHYLSPALGKPDFERLR